MPSTMPIICMTIASMPHDKSDTRIMITPFGGVSEYEFVNTEWSQQETANAGRNLFIGAARLPVLNRTTAISRRRLNWLIAADLWQWGLTMCADLRVIVILRATFGAIQSHLGLSKNMKNPPSSLEGFLDSANDADQSNATAELPPRPASGVL